MNRPWFSYAFTFSFATVFVQTLIFGYNISGITGALIAAATAYGMLGFMVGFIWPRDLIIQSIIAGTPAWLFILALSAWSTKSVLTTIIEGIPLVIEPISVSAFFFIGCWLGSKISVFRKQHLKNISA